ncbi:MAG TPA: TatD family hydrolase [Pyrinomonadaceae bacterium]|jgi:TatD DNase family protein|nr:TatD family hydrolase [Pyrinomonadaceae bacterium]
MYVDSHAHIDGEEFDDDRDEVIRRARAAGVRAILNVGTGDPHSGSLERAVQIAEKYDDVYTAVGVHPHDARLFDERAAERLESLLSSYRKIVALGEIGLDYHYDNSPRDEQRRAFARQLHMARALNLPVIIHSRDAEAETVEILRDEYTGAARRGVMHCFSGGREMAEQVLEMGFFISFAGNVTFKNAESLRGVARNVPLDKLLIETDCPYLSPAPLRGRRNEPAHVVATARCLAGLHELSVEELGSITSANFSRLFGVEFREMPTI